jgi:alpha-mannosidase
MRKIAIVTIMAMLCCYIIGAAQNASDTSKVQRDLYVVATSHLDTQWRWTIQNTINEFVPATFSDNFKLMDVYPNYKFSFEGAFRYMLLKEYYPDEYARLKGYIDLGQWNVAGSWVDAVDVNMPSFESLVRQALYGNGYFKKEFGKTSKDIFLPDCFGFGYALPSIAAHCGIESFSTQKLTWGCSVPAPFDIGLWQGVDASSIVAALNPGSYVSNIRDDLSRDSTWTARINEQGEKSGLYAAYRYFGTGDTGGSPDSLSVDWLSKAMKSNGPVKVHSIGSDELCNMIRPQLRQQVSNGPFAPHNVVNLPHYKGELVMTRHGTGCYTSGAAMKRWNRENELLADATERACVIANLVAGEPYPKEDLKNTWIRFLWHQFHDDLTGTSIPEAYQFSWNDELLCQNRFSQMLTHAVEATAAVMDTKVKGTPVVVYNPLSIWRQDVVETTINTLGEKKRYIRVYGPNGKEVPSQVISTTDDSETVLFPADVPSVGYVVYDVRPSNEPGKSKSELSVTSNSLENKRYKVTLNEKGEVASIYDKDAKRELLSAPLSLQFLHDKPGQWPAWEIQYEDITAPPMPGIIKDTNIEVKENGPVRVSLLITQKTNNSIIRTTISLAAGDAGDRVEFDNDVDWYERETLLKAAFNFTTPNDSVTYDLGLGTISRGINTEKKYEVPGQQWADMMAKDGSYGVAVLNDCKYGWDHPDSATLRLSLIHTPGVYESWNWVGDQKSQDNGHHHFVYAITGHKGDWRDGGVVWQAARLNQPLMGFVTTPHKGRLGREYSFAKSKSLFKWSSDHFSDRPLSDGFINSIKFAENSDNVIIRLHELYGRQYIETNLQFDRHIISAREINGVEDEIGPASVSEQEIVASMNPYQPKAFAVKLKRLQSEAQIQPYQIINLPYNIDGVSFDSNRKDGNFDGQGNTISGDLLPNTLTWLDVPYVMGPKADGQMNVLGCDGQSIPISKGEFNKLYLLGAAVGGPAMATFAVDEKETTVPLPDYAQFIGQWNSRVVAGEIREDIKDIAPGYINDVPVAWYGTHRHTTDGENEAYRFTYLYLITLDLPPGAHTVTLPINKNVKILAATAVKTNRDDVTAGMPLYDIPKATLTDIHAPCKSFLDSVEATITCPIPGAEVHYTIDGSDPTMASPLYAGPIVMTKTTTVKSRAFMEDADDHYVTSVTFNRLTPHEALAIEITLHGLRARYYEGHWDRLPDFDTVKVVKKFTARTVRIPDFARAEDFGLTFDGYIKVPADGLYNFYLSSDDGSRLYIGDSLVVDNDGLHGTGDVSGEIALKAGYHRISIPMFQAKGDEGLELSIEGPGMEKKQVPKEMLFH